MGDSPNGNWSLFRDSSVSHHNSECLFCELSSCENVASFSVVMVFAGSADRRSGFYEVGVAGAIAASAADLGFGPAGAAIFLGHFWVTPRLMTYNKTK